MNSTYRKYLTAPVNGFIDVFADNFFGEHRNYEDKKTRNMKVFVDQFIANNHGGGNIKLAVVAAFYDTSTNNIVDNVAIDVDMTGATSTSDTFTLSNTAILAYAAGVSYSISSSDIMWSFGLSNQLPTGLSNAPQAAISDAPTDAVTNYNVVTTLLGALTSAVNSANTKQNEIATKLNTLLSELRTLGLISV